MTPPTSNFRLSCLTVVQQQRRVFVGVTSHGPTRQMLGEGYDYFLHQRRLVPSHNRGADSCSPDCPMAYRMIHGHIPMEQIGEQHEIAIRAQVSHTLKGNCLPPFRYIELWRKQQAC